MVVFSYWLTARGKNMQLTAIAFMMIIPSANDSLILLTSVPVTGTMCSFSQLKYFCFRNHIITMYVHIIILPQ